MFPLKKIDHTSIKLDKDDFSDNNCHRISMKSNFLLNNEGRRDLNQ